MKRGILLILTGASSVGKGHIRDLIMQDRELNLFYSISITTRPQKEDEVDGKDYYFVNYESFAQALRKQELLEYTQFDGYYYGTPHQQVEFLLSSGKNVLVEVEAMGVGQIKLKYPEATAIFIVPESMEELEKQIRVRYRDDSASAERRISKARVEMELASLFTHQVKNTDPEAAYKIVKEIFMSALEKRD